MTAIEFLDRTPIENVVSTLTTTPDKIIFLGDSKLIEEWGGVYDSFIKKRRPETVVEYKSIIKNNLSQIVEELSSIVEAEEECVFDLTGGEDLALVAMGIVSQKYEHKNIQMQRFNVNSKGVTDCDFDGKVIYTGNPTLGVEELIRLHGGVVRYEKDGDDRTFKWDLNEDFIRDVNTLWDMCKINPGLWNTRLNVLGAIDDMGDNCKTLTVSADISSLREHMKRNNDKYISIGGFLKHLQQKQMIFSLVDDGQTVSFTYKNQQIKKCLIKSGTVFELKVLTVASRLTDKKGEAYYSDSMNGVYIDWDGLFHEKNDTTKDTENEIDVVLMKGLVPVFVSCKNGFVEDDELYKLEAVTNRFGGRYAKKVLLATYLGKKAKSLDYFKQRADDMNIKLVEGLHLLTDSQFEKVIKHIFNS